jgi:ATP-binding cassette subfamily B protein
LLFLISALFLTIEAIAELMQPTMMSMIVDVGIQNKNVGQILTYGLIMLCIAAVGAVGAIIRNILASKTSQLVGMELRGDLYRKVQTLSIESVDRLKPSALITRITNDVTQVVSFVQGTMRLLLKAPVMCIGAIIFLVVQTPEQFPVILLILLCCFLFIFFNMKLAYPKYRKIQEKLDRLNRQSREFLTSVRVVKAFNAEDSQDSKFREAAYELSMSGVRASKVLAVFGPLINLTVNFGIVLLLWRSRSQNATEIGNLMASVNYMTQILFALANVSNILNISVRATASSHRIKEVFDETGNDDTFKDFAQPPASMTKHPTTYAIAFTDCTLTYAQAPRPALSDLTFSILRGEMVGIIGATGSGKSSMVNLIPRFYSLEKGQICVDGVDITQLPLTQLRQKIAVVPQKALLFSGSIKDNLLFGNPNASDEQMHHAAESACADDFVRTFADGYDTILGQGGVNLSGGQKQRLCIARALLANAQILILDDCTSALDATTEAKVLNALQTQAQDKTVLLISQRISTVLRCDRILCLEDGKLVGFGQHNELMQSCRIYREIYESQIGVQESHTIHKKGSNNG